MEEELEDEDSFAFTTNTEEVERLGQLIELAASGPAPRAEDMGAEHVHHHGEQCVYCSWGLPEGFYHL